MIRYTVTLDFQVWAPGPTEAFIHALALAAKIKPIPAGVLEQLDLAEATGGITGEPRTAEGPGWRCVYKIQEDE